VLLTISAVGILAEAIAVVMASSSDVVFDARGKDILLRVVGHVPISISEWEGFNDAGSKLFLRCSV